METSSIETKVQAFIDALHALEQGSTDDAGQLVALFAPDAVVRNPALDSKGEEAKGSDAILQFWVEYKDTLGQIKSEFHYKTVAENAAGLFWTTTGTRPNGEAIKYQGATLIQFNAAGLIDFLRGYYDTQELVVRGEG